MSAIKILPDIYPVRNSRGYGYSFIIININKNVSVAGGIYGDF
ncbi:MAG: hypothetical protein AB1472_01135 [Candidatus Omnitrophota bacterium]